MMIVDDWCLTKVSKFLLKIPPYFIIADVDEKKENYICDWMVSKYLASLWAIIVTLLPLDR